MPLLPVILFAACVLLSAFFASAETAFIGSNPYTLAYLEKKGSRRAAVVKKTLGRIDDFLATILIAAMDLAFFALSGASL